VGLKELGVHGGVFIRNLGNRHGLLQKSHEGFVDRFNQLLTRATRHVVKPILVRHGVPFLDQIGTAIEVAADADGLTAPMF
jgi:hypothetical protein